MRWFWVAIVFAACSFDGVQPGSTDSGRAVDASAADAAGVDADVPPNAFRRVITINPGTLAVGDVDDLPVPITLSSDAHYRDNARVDGSDLLVLFGNMQLPLDIERIDVSTGDLIAWVVVPKVMAGAATSLELYYGAGQSAPADNRNPWQMVADAVWHFESIGVAPTVDDHSPNNVDGTSNGNGSLTATAGVHGDAFDFRDAVVFAPDGDALNRDQNASFTISLWFNQQNTNGDSDYAFYKGGPRLSVAGYEFPLGSFTWRANLRDSDGDSLFLEFGAEVNMAAGWHQLAMVVDRVGGEVLLYLDGALADSDPIGDLGDLRSSEVARIGGDNEPPDAFIDEFRSYPSARSADHMALDYAIGLSLSTVVTVAAPEAIRYPGT